MTAVPSGPVPLAGGRARRCLRGGVLGGALAASLAVSAGCAADPEQSGSTATEAPAAWLAATVKQYREDEIAGRLQVSLTNRGSEVVLVESVGVASQDFAPAGPSRPALRLAPGERTDVPVAYGAVRCAGTVPRSAGPAVVHVDVVSHGQPARPITLAVPPAAALDRLVERSCRREQLGRVLDVAVLDVRIPRDGDRADANVRVDVGRTSERALTLTSVEGSVMFDLELADTATVQPGGSATVPVRIRPGRCDPHAFLESKRTFLFTAYVQPSAGEASYLGFALEDEDTQARLTAWARRRCGL